MTRLALLCSGQGFQHPDMFALTAEAPAAAPVFAAATRVLGRDPREAVAGDDLHDNAVAQVLCCTQALAAAAALAGAVGDEPIVVAGYSVGELAAWGVAGVFDAATTLALAHRRATAMDDAGKDGGLAAIRGLPRTKLAALCEEHGAHVAIVNGPDQLVIGGERAALEATLDAARHAGAGKITRLAVRVASHTPLLAGAVAPFRQALAAVVASPLRGERRLLAGVDGSTVFAAADGLDKLARQLAEPVDWQACMEACRAAGAERMLELGPGNALAHLAEAQVGARDSRALDDFRSLDGVCRWLRA